MNVNLICRGIRFGLAAEVSNWVCLGYWCGQQIFHNSNRNSRSIFLGSQLKILLKFFSIFWAVISLSRFFFCSTQMVAAQNTPREPDHPSSVRNQTDLRTLASTDPNDNKLLILHPSVHLSCRSSSVAVTDAALRWFTTIQLVSWQLKKSNWQELTQLIWHTKQHGWSTVRWHSLMILSQLILSPSQLKWRFRDIHSLSLGRFWKPHYWGCGLCHAFYLLCLFSQHDVILSTSLTPNTCANWQIDPKLISLVAFADGFFISVLCVWFFRSERGSWRCQTR
jgi:hypothetical protein